MINNVYAQITLVKYVTQDGLAIGTWNCNKGNKMPVSLAEERKYYDGKRD